MGSERRTRRTLQPHARVTVPEAHDAVGAGGRERTRRLRVEVDVVHGEDEGGVLDVGRLVAAVAAEGVV